ncbi:MAG TPA: ECF transporter S component [Clostridia bacterium]|nr:ECF transporter S component [Clostridia bacterium]
MKKQSTLLTVTTAMLVALGILFPQIFHLIPDGGTLFSPMHIPVLLCGLICGSLMGALAGLLIPVLSCLIFGMPPFPMPLIPMTAELVAYGFFAGFFMRLFDRTNKMEKISYIPSLILSMICGRIVYIFIRIALLAVIMPTFDFGVLLVEAITATTVSTWAGIITQIIFIPLVMLALKKGHILEKYPYIEKRS